MLSVLITHRKNYQNQNTHTHTHIHDEIFGGDEYAVMVSQHMHLSKLIKMYTLNTCNF